VYAKKADINRAFALAEKEKTRQKNRDRLYGKQVDTRDYSKPAHQKQHTADLQDRIARIRREWTRDEDGIPENYFEIVTRKAATTENYCCEKHRGVCRSHRDDLIHNNAVRNRLEAVAAVRRVPTTEHGFLSRRTLLHVATSEVVSMNPSVVTKCFTCFCAEECDFLHTFNTFT
jgi:hypothetical protein